MAELMFGLGQTKKKKQTEAKVRDTKATLRDVNITDTVEGAVRKDQHNRELADKSARKSLIKNNQNVNVTETVETNSRKDQHNRELAEKAAVNDTLSHLKDVTITDTVEGEVRKEQHAREQEWKATGKQNKDDNTNFDMARALFN